MTIIKYGEGKFQRVGVVIGEYEHTLHGRCKMVRTPYNYVTGQQFDNVPAAKVQPARMGVRWNKTKPMSTHSMCKSDGMVNTWHGQQTKARGQLAIPQ